MNRCMIIGAMSHASGGENTKLLTMTIGIQRNACCDSAGVIKTVITSLCHDLGHPHCSVAKDVGAA
jgi:hypothetical protein